MYLLSSQLILSDCMSTLITRVLFSLRPTPLSFRRCTCETSLVQLSDDSEWIYLIWPVSGIYRAPPPLSLLFLPRSLCQTPVGQHRTTSWTILVPHVVFWGVFWGSQNWWGNGLKIHFSIFTEKIVAFCAQILRRMTSNKIVGRQFARCNPVTSIFWMGTFLLCFCFFCVIIRVQWTILHHVFEVRLCCTDCMPSCRLFETRRTY